MNIEKKIWALLKENAKWIEKQGGARKGFIKKASIEWRRQRNDMRKKYTTNVEFEQGLQMSDVKYHLGYKVSHSEEHFDVINFAKRVIAELRRMVYDYEKVFVSEDTLPAELFGAYNNLYKYSPLALEFVRNHPDNRAVQRWLQGKKEYKKTQREYELQWQ